MDISSPLPAYIAYSVGYVDDRDLIAWAVEYLPTSEYFSEDPHLVELSRLDTKQGETADTAGGLLAAFVAERWPDFDPHSPKSEMYAQGYFRRGLKEYLAETRTPWRVCRMIDRMRETYGLPVGLRSIQSDHERIKPDTQPSECPHLREAIEKSLSAP